MRRARRQQGPSTSCQSSERAHKTLHLVCATAAASSMACALPTRCATRSMRITTACMDICATACANYAEPASRMSTCVVGPVGSNSRTTDDNIIDGYVVGPAHASTMPTRPRGSQCRDHRRPARPAPRTRSRARARGAGCAMRVARPGRAPGPRPRPARCSPPAHTTPRTRCPGAFSGSITVYDQTPAFTFYPLKSHSQLTPISLQCVMRVPTYR
jgi:hypothetical protein